MDALDLLAGAGVGAGVGLAFWFLLEGARRVVRCGGRGQGVTGAVWQKGHVVNTDVDGHLDNPERRD